MAIQEKCRILAHQKLAPNFLKLTLESAYISSRAEPGQFVNLRCALQYDPLLRRPLSIHNAFPEHHRFELLYEVVGKGTELLSCASVGSELDILGPLGKGFSIQSDKQIAVLVAGGMGVAPLLFLAWKLSKTVKALYVFLGSGTRDKVLCEKEFKETGAEIIVATDDGSYGKRGLISDVLLELLEDQLATYNLQLTTIYTCGPREMLRAVAEIAFQKKIDCQVSMEAHMACGIGTCLGCVIETKNGYKKVCDEGPVFDAQQIIWEIPPLPLGEGERG